MRERTGRVTIPTNLDIVPETIELMKRWGADAIRDCDGTEFPKELVETGAKIYATYYTTRKIISSALRTALIRCAIISLVVSVSSSRAC